MTLSSMLKVVNTVDSEWRSLLAQEILERWGYDEGSVYYLRASANFIFVFRKNGERYFLRFIEGNQKSLEEIEAEIEILLFLQSQAIKVAQPVLSLNEKNIEVVETVHGTFYATVFKGLDGKQFEIDELIDQQFFEWGTALGRLHQGLKRMPEQYRCNRPGWDDHLSFVKEMLPLHEVAALIEWEIIKEWVESLPISQDNYGLIHFDFELDNLIFDEDEIGILDFDDCANYWYAADIAFALRDIFGEKNDLTEPSFQTFLSGYKSETDIDMELVVQLPMFMRLHKLVLFARLLRTVDLPVSPDYPEWLQGLREKLLRYLDNLRLSFERNSGVGKNDI